ncbi:replicative DNA helicase [soil metagenome]
MDTVRQGSRANVLSIDELTGNIPPHSTEAEVAVLGAMLMDKEAVSKVLEVLQAECFYHDKHETIFKAMTSMFERGVTIDLITLNNELSRNGDLERVGGMFTLTDISTRTVTAANVEHHARIVLERYLKRSLIKVAGQIIADCFDETTDALDEVDHAEQRIFEVAERRLKRSYSGMKKLTRDAIDKIFQMSTDGDGVTGVPTGFTHLDQMLSGLQPSDLVILAARPSMGKTAFALSIAREAAERGKAVGFFSLEMSSHQLVLRLISADSEINLQKLRSGQLSQNDMQNIVKKVDKLMNAPIYIDDSAALSPVEFRAKCRRMKMEHKIDLVVVDYLQLMHAPKAESREREISMISHTLKQVAKELDIPVLALSQLNRTLESRADKRPMLSDLRESGSIEQDADVVMFVHRPSYYKIEKFEDGTSTDNIAEIIVGKQRNGPTGDVRLFYNKELARFHDLSYHHAAFEAADEPPYLAPPDAPF